VADEDRQVRVHEIVVPEHGPRVQEGAYDVSLVVDTSPPTRWEPTLAKIAEPELKRSAYDASLVVDTTPPTRWEPTAETGGESANSGAAGGDTASDGGPIAVKASLTSRRNLRGAGSRHLWRRLHSRRVLGPLSRCYASRPERKDAVGSFLDRFRRVRRDHFAAEGSPEGAALGFRAARQLAALGQVNIEHGLTEAELVRVERTFGFQFADDHRAFLAAGLPTGPSWPDWRTGDLGALRDRLGWPVHGVLFDVEHNGYWHESWGDRPSNRREAVAAAERHLRNVPQMVPVFGHRFLPPGRGTFGHPVLSMYQTDIIYYGNDLEDYIYSEFGGPAPTRSHEPQATVAFWRDFV
jgi:hypothetical protein